MPSLAAVGAGNIIGVEIIGDRGVTPALSSFALDPPAGTRLELPRPAHYAAITTARTLAAHH